MFRIFTLYWTCNGHRCFGFQHFVVFAFILFSIFACWLENWTEKEKASQKRLNLFFLIKWKLCFFVWLYYCFFVINLVENNFFSFFFFQNESIAVRVIYSISLVLFVYVLILVTVRFLCTKAMDVHVIFFVLSRLCFYFIFCFV